MHNYGTLWSFDRKTTPLHLGGFVVGATCAVISAKDLSNNQVGTIAQITLIALPVLSILRSLYVHYKNSHLSGRTTFTHITPLPIAFLLGVNAVLLWNTLRFPDSASLCNFYSTCKNSQPHFIDACKSIQATCHEKLEMARWRCGPHPLGGSKALLDLSDVNSENNFKWHRKPEAVLELCSRVFEPGKGFNNGDPSRWFYRPSQETLEEVIQLQEKLYAITQCNPDIGNNAYHQFFSMAKKEWSIIVLPMFIYILAQILYKIEMTPPRPQRR